MRPSAIQRKSDDHSPAKFHIHKKQCSIQAGLNILEVLHQETMSSTVYEKYSKYLIVVSHSHYWKCEVKTLKEFATGKRKCKRKNKHCCTVITAYWRQVRKVR